MPERLQLDLTLYPTPVLRKVAEAFEAVDDAVRELAAGMFELMYASKGVGLAAPQVGLKRRLMVLDASGGPEDGGTPEDALALINPVLLETSGPRSKFDEGCLSFPGIYAEVERPERCRIEALDLEGNRIEQEFDGFVSRIIQHEYDHLEGVLLVDRMSPADKLRNKADLEELVERYRRSRAPR